MEKHLNTNMYVLQRIKEANKENFTKLDLSNNKLTNIPKEIGELKNLTTLDLSSNSLIELPKEIGELKNLTALDLSSNRLTKLPKEIGELKNLTRLQFICKPVFKLALDFTLGNKCHLAHFHMNSGYPRVLTQY